MKIIILAMHGAPPLDFPPQETAELFSLHSRLEHYRGPERPALERRYAELEAKMRAWPRRAENDPFHAGSLALAAALEKACGCPVVTGFNEFCAPSLPQALDTAAEMGAAEVVVVTPMMTRGGEHAEKEIPAEVESAQARHPAVAFRYAWPFPVEAVAGFLARQSLQK